MNPLNNRAQFGRADADEASRHWGIFLFAGFSSLVFGVLMGFLWLGTVPLTNGVIAQIFGVRHLAMLSGFVFFSHQFGSFLGAWLGGWLFDRTGSYDIAWVVAIALGVIAGLVHLPIDERPLARRATSGAAASS